MKKFILLKKLGFSFVILLVLFFANSANAVTIKGTLSNGANGEIEVANNSKIDKDTATVNISIDFDPGTTPFNLPSGVDEIIIRVKTASGTSFGATNVYVANQKPTSDPIIQSKVPAQDYYNTYPDSNSVGNKVRLTIEGSSDKKIYYQSDEFKVFSYTKQNPPTPTDNTKYYFTWQDIAGGFKIEREVIGKDACEAERNSGQYKITTPCSTTSQKTQNDAFNKTAGLFQFTWKMDNFITKASLSGGGTTSAECELNKAGKTSSITPAELKNWTLTKSCLNLTGVDAYYFTWQENNDSLKSEVAFTNKSDCEKERVNTKYKNATACYTPSKQDEINIYNKALIVDPQTQPKKFYSDYTLLAPVGNLEKIGSDSNTKIGDYMNILLLIAIGLCGALAVIMIVIRGVQYMGEESVFGKTEAKQQIMQAIIGLLLALGAYAILNTISPKLVGGSLNFNSVNIVLTSGNDYRLESTQQRDKIFRKTSYYDQVKKYVNDANYSNFYSKKIHHCMAQVAIQRETNGNPSLIGHDEDAPLNGVPSRKRFVESGTKDSGVTFSGSITDRNLFNDDHEGSNIHTSPVKNNANYDLGLDWRFSHGIGLMQVTFFPAGSNDGPNYNVGFNTLITKTPMKLKDMLTPEKAIQSGVEHLQYNFKQCGGDVEKAYRAYGGGSCNSGGFMNSEAPLRKKLFDQCVAQDK